MLAVLLRIKIMPSNISSYRSNVVSNVNLGNETNSNSTGCDV